jgi:WXG100 family type VII secretion target
VPEPIKVDPQDLAHAAERIRGYADQLRAGHGSSVAEADGAQAGLVGQSARAIDSRTQRWQTTTADLYRVLSSQADALSSAAAAYAGTEDNNRDMIASVDPTSL